jgi:OmpA-OmpF porin, OOP family
MRKHVAGCLAAIATLISAAGCTTIVSAQTPGTGCPWETAPPPPHQPSSDTVVLVDNTASFWPKAGQHSLQPDDPVSITVSSLLRNFATSGTRLVSFGTFDGSSATINWKLSGAALPTATGNDTEIQAEQRSAANCLTRTVTSAVGVGSRAPGTDVMAALAAAGQQLQGGGPLSGDQVVVVTDGLSNTGCLNLSAVISQGKPASVVPGSCPEHTGLAMLRGVSLRLFGIGFQAVQPPLTTAEQAWVETYWSEMCTALAVSSSASCVAPAGADTTRSSAGTHLGDPGIVFPSISKGTKVVPVPADLLFAFNSATLSTAGQAYLGILAQQVKAQRRAIIKVIGHTDAVGAAAYNLDLSRRRAKAVVDYLAQAGFAHVTAAGVGEADPACSPQYTAAGAPMQSCMAKDRRVQIILGG